jgi:hypothetical protein
MSPVFTTTGIADGSPSGSNGADMQNDFDTGRFFKVLGLALLVLLAVAVPLGLIGPTKPDTKGYNSAVNAALAAAASNNSSAQGAPQQAVVNGWLARDLMEIQIKQNDDELVLLHLSVVVLIAALVAVIIAGGVAATGGRAEESDGENLWTEPPDADDTPDDCAEWFVHRLTVALSDGRAGGRTRFRSDDLLLLGADTAALSEATRRKVIDLTVRASASVQQALAHDTRNARAAGLLDAGSGLPLSWVKNYEKSLGATKYPVAARIAAAVAAFDESQGGSTEPPGAEIA